MAGSVNLFQDFVKLKVNKRKVNINKIWLSPVIGGFPPGPPARFSKRRQKAFIFPRRPGF